MVFWTEKTVIDIYIYFNKTHIANNSHIDAPWPELVITFFFSKLRKKEKENIYKNCHPVSPTKSLKKKMVKQRKNKNHFSSKTFPHVIQMVFQGFELLLSFITAILHLPTMWQYLVVLHFSTKLMGT